MLKRLSVIVLLLIGAVTFAQEATSEPSDTPSAEVTPEMTAEATSSAGDTCPMIVANAINLTQINCSDTDRNEACYGYNLISADFRSEDAEFDVPGDIEDVLDIQSLQLSPLDELSGDWGLMVLEVEPNANLNEDGALPEDDVQIVLYGDTQLSDATQFVEVTAISDVNIREFPRTTSGVIGSLTTGQPVVANGRLPDNSWFRIRLVEDGVSGLGWVSAQFLEAGFDPDTLPEITAEQAEQPAEDVGAIYGPMQAFIFESGENDAPCDEAPNSGMLIQTPEGIASITIWLDEVVVELDGTGVITAQANGNLTVGVIEGSAQVNANGQTSTAIAGQAVDVPLNDDLVPNDVPSAPRPIDPSEVQGIPTQLVDDAVDIPTPNNSPLASATGGLNWGFNFTTQPPYICSDGSEVTINSAGVAPTIEVEPDALVISGLRFPEVSDGVYRTVYNDGNGNIVQDTLQIVSTDRIVGERTIDFANPICTITLSFTIQLGS